jgi:peroxiredoxin
VKGARWGSESKVKWSFTESSGVAVSFSGEERNHLFVNEGVAGFRDVSGISGLDSVADGRTFVRFDYDRDGWEDVALVNTNRPFLNLFHNEIGAARDRAEEAPPVVAVRFVGANRSAQAAAGRSNRDGYGARVVVSVAGVERVREHRCGDGFAAQNGATILVGLGDREVADEVRVHWPGGGIQRIGPVRAGSLLTFHEDASQAPASANEAGIVRESYARRAPNRGGPRPPPKQRLVLAPADAAASPIHLYTTTATWCESCKKSLPQLQVVRSSFGSNALAMYGVPVDEDDGAEKLAAYVERYRPAYRLLSKLGAEQIAEVVSLVVTELGSEVLPASIVTDREGRVLATLAGVPSISDLRRVMDEAGVAPLRRLSAVTRSGDGGG